MRILAAAAALLVASAPTVAFADITTFASATEASPMRSIAFVEFSGGPGGALFTRASNGPSTFAAAQTNFNYLLTQAGGTTIPTLSSDFKFMATTHDYATLGVATFQQGGFAGSFSYIYNGATPFTINGKTYSGPVNLLSGTFSNAVIVGLNSGSTGGVYDSTTSLNFGDISFTSDVVALPNNVANDFSLTLAAATPRFQLTGDSTHGDLKSFTASATGAYSSDLEPVVNGAVPEMATWMMMIMGFGLIGGSLRTRRIGATIRLPSRSREADFA